MTEPLDFLPTVSVTSRLQSPAGTAQNLLNPAQPMTSLATTTRTLLILLVGLLPLLSTGCSATHGRYVEEHEIKQLTVVFLDEASLHERWSKIAGREAIRLTVPMNSQTPIVKTVRGFYDYSTNTLYCEKWNFEVCGHELHHAALGQFHPQH